MPHRKSVLPVPRRAYPAIAVALAGLVLAALAGCGIIGERYVYLEWYTSYFEKYYVRWFDDFEKAHADEHVRISFKAMPSNAQQMVYTMLISHSLSDVITVGLSTAPLLMDNNALEPVAPGDVDRSDFMPLSLKMASLPDGTLVGYPGGSEIRPFMYFNRDAFKEAGTSEADVPETFDEYNRWAAKLFKWEINGKPVLGLPAHEVRIPYYDGPIGAGRKEGALGDGLAYGSDPGRSVDCLDAPVR